MIKNFSSKIGRRFIKNDVNLKAFLAKSFSITAITSAVVSSAAGAVASSMVDKRKLCKIYDTKRGHYIETKRRLKADELIEFDERFEKGELPSKILKDLGLLKD